MEIKDNSQVEKRKNQAEQNNLFEKAAFVIGGAFLLFGLVIAIILISNYRMRHDPVFMSCFSADAEIQDLAATLAGTTGILWALGGTIFFIYTIYQTKHSIVLQMDEMQQTNNSLVNQRYQTTFFNLLENHTRLINNLTFKDDIGQKGLARISNSIKEDYEIYMNQLLKKYFNNFHITRLHPYRIIKENRSSVESYIKNFVTILNFIENSQNDKDFYKELLSNYLSVNEKVLIGAYINSINDRNSSLIENTSNYMYLFCNEYYMSYYKFKKNQDIHFPFINLFSKIHGNFTDSSENIFNQEDIFKYNIYIDNNVNLDEVTLVLLNLKVYQFNDNSDSRGIELFSTNKPFIENTNFIDLNEVVEDYIINTTFEGCHIFVAEFVFDINGNHYVIKDEFNIVNERFKNFLQLTVKSNINNYDLKNTF